MKNTFASLFFVIAILGPTLIKTAAPSQGKILLAAFNSDGMNRLNMLKNELMSIKPENFITQSGILSAQDMQGIAAVFYGVSSTTVRLPEKLKDNLAPLQQYKDKIALVLFVYGEPSRTPPSRVFGYEGQYVDKVFQIFYTGQKGLIKEGDYKLLMDWLQKKMMR